MIPLMNYRITQLYGVKNSRYFKGYHTGVDMVSEDLKIYAATAGTVIEARYAPGEGADPAGWGNYVVVRTYDGQYDMLYAHLASLEVSTGPNITEGTILGQIGSTGQSTGPHLHFEVRKGSWQNLNDIDPLQWLVQIDKKFTNLILTQYGPDERAAGYLADYLKAPVVYLDSVKISDIDAAKYVYQVGGAKKYEKATLLSGLDRFETCQAVLNFIQNREI